MSTAARQNMDSNRDLLLEEQFLIFNDFKHYDDVIRLISTIPEATKLQATEERLEEELISELLGFSSYFLDRNI